MKLILDKGVASCEREGSGFRGHPQVIYEGFLLWAYREGLLEGLTSHFRDNPMGEVRRVMLANLRYRVNPEKWAMRIAQGRVTINGRIVCELDLAESPQVAEHTKLNS